MTWLTLDAPLVEVGGITATLIGSQHDPKVWRDHVAPTQTVYSWVMNNHWHTNYRAEQEGPTVFCYILWPHDLGFLADTNARRTAVLTHPLLALPARGDRLCFLPFTVSSSGLQITALKRSDDGRGWIVRLFGASGTTRPAKLTWIMPGRDAVWLSDTSERPLQPLNGPVAVPAYGVVTLRVDRANN